MDYRMYITLSYLATARIIVSFDLRHQYKVLLTRDRFSLYRWVLTHLKLCQRRIEESNLVGLIQSQSKADDFSHRHSHQDWYTLK